MSSKGHAQARELADALGRTRVEHIFSSPYVRCLQTAGPCAAALGRPIKVETGLMEAMCEFSSPPRVGLLVGEVEGFPVDAGYAPRLAPTFPESLADTYARAGQVVVELAASYAGDLLFVGHEYTVIAGARALLGVSGDELPLGCPTTGVFHLVAGADGGWTLRRNADVSHLSEPRDAFRGVEAAEVELWLGYHELSSLSELPARRDPDFVLEPNTATTP